MFIQIHLGDTSLYMLKQQKIPLTSNKLLANKYVFIQTANYVLPQEKSSNVTTVISDSKGCEPMINLQFISGSYLLVRLRK